MRSSKHNTVLRVNSKERILIQAQSLAHMWLSLPKHHIPAYRHIPSAHYGYNNKRRSGHGDQFWQYRPFEAGEPAQAIDWRQYGRTDKYFVRETQEQKPNKHLIWCDSSPSMFIPETKSQTAHIIALAVMIYSIHEGHKVTLCFADSFAHTPEQAISIIDKSTDIKTDKAFSLKFDQLTCISDFFSEETLRSTQDLARRQTCAPLFIQTLTQDEQQFSFFGHVQLEDQVHPPLKHLSIEAVRKDYLEKLHALQNMLSRFTKQHNGQHVIHTTQSNPIDNLALTGAVCSR